MTGKLRGEREGRRGPARFNGGNLPARVFGLSRLGLFLPGRVQYCYAIAQLRHCLTQKAGTHLVSSL
jgi:hypothetical protein